VNRVISRLVALPRRHELRHALRDLSPRYRIERELGQGGMAVVYLATDRQLDREVAIKVLQATLSADMGSIARLRNEARLVAQMHHPNIVAIYDLERLHDRSVALVMQYVRGRTLRAIIDESGELPVALVERVLTEIASALEAAHQQGIVHRDVKPENIYLDQESGRALLADFGIAHAPGLETGLTLMGEALGTPQYMSPEQIAGGELDGRSDLYSLGLVGYEMLTGQRPWSGESLYQILYRQQHEYLPSLRERRPDTPTALRLSLERVLRKDPARRPASAQAFLDLLHRDVKARVSDEVVDLAGGDSASSSPAASPDAPTIVYRRPHGESDDSPVEQPPSPEPKAPGSLPWLLSPEEERAAVRKPAPGPTRAPAPAPPPESRPSAIRAGGLADRDRIPRVVTGGGTGAHVRKSTIWPKAFAVAGASAATFFIVLFGLLAAPPNSTVQAESMPVAEPAAEEFAQPEPADIEPTRSSGATPPPVYPRGGRAGGSRAASGSYRPAGDLSDIFCRPRGEETLDEWIARVPAHCVPRIR
jgi:serine/threonine protein kinase